MMWDFGGRDTIRYRSRSRSPHPPHQLRVPSPVFPIPVARSHSPSGYGYPTPINSSYPSLNTGYDPYLSSYHEYPSISRVPPSPHYAPPPSPIHPQPSYPPNQVPTQVIHVIHHSKNHSSKSKSKKHRQNTQPQTPLPTSAPSTGVTFPSASHFLPPITPSTSYHSAPPTVLRQQRVHFSSKPPSIVPDTIRPRVNSVPERPSDRQQVRRGALRKPDARGRTHVHSHSQPQPHHAQNPVDPLNPNFQYSRCTGRKKALCIGINYRGQANELRGCVNDAKHVRDFLIRSGGYKSSDILLLTDDSKDSRSLPTRDNVIQAMMWLVRGAKKDDSLFFHYSGHGGQTPDLNGDEVDDWDEVIYPLDFKTKGPIIDDEMHAIMVKTLPAGCRLTGLFDACHSGTVLDLPYIYSSHGRLKGKHVSDRMRRAKATPADVISWSGCRDGETSADTFAGGVAVGAMSYAFITALKNKPQQTYQELLRSVRLILHPRFSQRPQLGSSHQINTNLQFVF